MKVSHRKEIRKLTFRALALRRSESTKGASSCFLGVYEEDLDEFFNNE